MSKHIAEWQTVARIEDLPPDRLVARTIGMANIVLIRRGNDVVAFRDRCPHRFAPLSLGKLEGDVIQCPYHGLRFGLDGRCVLNPHGDGAIPDNLKLIPVAVRRDEDRICVALDQEHARDKPTVTDA